MALGDGLRRFLRDVGGPPTKDGIAELKVGDPSYDDWEVVRDFGELETARAWRQQITDAGLEAVLTSDWPLDEWGRGDIALRVPPGQWSAANEALDEPDV
ncbi:MAG: hypothetical protein M3M99_05385 [Actinomycetota bacterium]|nr:hypothetical protein [Actinomycetota bacterium]